MTPVVEVRPDQRQTLQERARATVQQIREGESTIKAACLQLFHLHVEFVTKGGVEDTNAQGERFRFTGFFDWLEWLGYSRGTAFNHLNAGYALNAGHDPDGLLTLTELQDLGAAIKNGATEAEVKAADTPKKKAQLSEAKRNAGLVRMFIPEVYAPEAEVIAERAIRLNLAPGKPEALGLALIAVSTLNDTEFQTLLERQTG